MAKQIIKMDLNRVEGDLEIKLEVDDHTVTDAWCVGTMYRGFEQILVGRAPTDALVITPRICGICSTSQLYAATSALEVAFQTPLAPNATRIRNLCLMAEAVMSDARHTFLMFAPDFCNPAYRGQPLYGEALELFEPPFKGRVARETVYHSKQILGIVIAFGGQWPHATYMMPGGVTCPLTEESLAACLAAIDDYTQWYEQTVLGCRCERWLGLNTMADFFAWLDETEAHRHSAVGVFARFGRALGLHQTGQGTPHLLSTGCYYDPENWQPPFTARQCLQPAGFYDGETDRIESFDQRQVAEHVRYSWYADYGGGRHPWEGETQPDYQPDGDRYTYAKAPRYQDQVVQLGPLSDLVIAGDRLLTSFFQAEGANTWLRQFTRFHRPVSLLQQMRRTVIELQQHFDEPTFIKSALGAEGEGCGLINASRGSLGHWVKIKDGRIANYQVITPTSWNGSPRDSANRRGHWEESFIGLEIKDLDNPIELCHVVRSHDACLVCTVHFVKGGRKRTFLV
ncbi:MAG: nickel-dependent hydrogenase large subunit [Pyrinomonadaceae bacterium]|nr:nickel-dependent hydrogenase large subunit [Pyrinomonadaceae bacterium]